MSVSDLLNDSGLSLLAAELGLSNILVTVVSLDSVSNNLSLNLLGDLLGESWVGTDGSVSSLVHLLNLITSDTGLDEVRELSLVRLWVLLLKMLHVASNVSTEDSILMDLGVVFAILTLTRVSWESLNAVWDINATIASTLKGTEESGTNSGSVETNIHDSLEWSALTLEVISNVELVTSGLLLSNESGIETNLLQQTASQQETSAVSSRVVLQTDGDSVLSELSGEGLAQNAVTLDCGVHDLADDLRVGSSDNETVLMGVVLVLILLDQSSSLSVVSLILSSTSVLGLESLVVSVGLNSLDKCHLELARDFFESILWFCKI